MREKSEIPEEKLEGKIGPMMCVHMDANVVRSQLRSRPERIGNISKGTILFW